MDDEQSEMEIKEGEAVILDRKGRMVHHMTLHNKYNTVLTPISLLS